MAFERKPPFAKRLLVASLLAAMAAALPLGVATTQAQAPAAVTLANAQFKGVTTPGPRFDLVQSVIELAPGARTPAFAATVPTYLTVVGGDISVDLNGSAETVANGKGIAAPAGATVSVNNAASNPRVRLFASTLVEPGVVPKVHLLSGVGVKVFATSRLTMEGAPATVDITQAANRTDVGYRTPNHIMLQPHLMTHVEGTTEYAYLDGLKEYYGPGAQAEMYVGRPGYMANAGQVPVSNYWTWVAAPGAPLSGPVPAAATPSPSLTPAPPATGTGTAQPADRPGWVLAAAGLALGVIALGLAVRAPRRQRPA